MVGINNKQKIRIIARLEINNNYVIKGKYFEGLRKIETPNKLSKKYYLEGIDEIIFTDAVASLYDRNSLLNIIKTASREIFVPITVGGGIRNLKDINNALKAGADKIAINSAAFKNINFLKKAVKEFGSSTIVGSVVAHWNKNYWECYIDNAKHATNVECLSWIKQIQDIGVGEILISSKNTDGIGKGFELDLIKKICEITNIPVIASSGAGNIDHIIQVCNYTGCQAVALASILHYNKTNVKIIKNQLSKKSISIRI